MIQRPLHILQGFEKDIKSRDILFQGFFLFGTVLLEILEKIDLVLDLPGDPFARKIKAGILIRSFELAAADQRGAPEFGMPYAPERVAMVIEKNDVDIMLDRKLDRIGGDCCRSRDENTLDLVSRDFECFLIRFHEKTVVGFLQVGSPGVDDELHALPPLLSAFSCRTAPNPRETDFPMPR